MSLRYEWVWDLAAIGAVAVDVDDDGAAAEARIASGTYGHTSIATVEDIEGEAVTRYASHTAFAAALKTALDAASTGAGVYTVTWSWPTGYTISYSNGNFTLTFSTVTDAEEGTLLRQILGFSGDLSGAATYSSNVRPYFVIVPAIEGRSKMSDEQPPDDVMEEATADDGTAYQWSRDSVEAWSDWTQSAETEEAPGTWSDPGTPPYRRQRTAAVPWTYQQAWWHMGDEDHVFLVIEETDAGTEQAVHQIRAAGAGLSPQRYTGDDQPCWSIPFRTRLIGRLP